ncbi:hypothetical protein K491DRAFT_710510 [Lophiostoma macrostomum CBS 122681]|uniref:Uncharacterized protein n=1 Tax=Lophiostoma macrostomum CBS 122681 TaxID=1314788 RepID=A0A6A6TNM6_9PLEO|nr:hypothetical protein K491DRAFT_710510 [Lophiostoma macrostomum CBS 122681]
MTNLLMGPVPTQFDPPTTCLQVTTSGSDPKIFSESYSLFIGNFNAYYKQGNWRPQATSCYPSATTSIDFWQNYYYSPAFCPTGYNAVCAYTAGDGTYNLPSTVTASVCCPPGFGCVNGWAHGCQKLTSGVVSSVFIAADPTATLTDLSSQLTTVSLAQSYYIWHDGVPVAWETTDTDILSQSIAAVSRASVAATAGSTASTSQPTTTAPGPTSTSSTPTHAPSSGLSSGAKIGIGVGAGVLAIALILGAFLLLRRRAKKQNYGAVQLDDTTISRKHGESERYAMHAEPSELGVGHGGSRELYTQPVELMGDVMSHEMPTPVNEKKR